MTSRWFPGQVAGIAAQTGWALPAIAGAEPLLPGLVLWDMWPLADRAGATVTLAGRQWWFFLAAPRRDDPALRHDEAHIRLLARDEGWTDHGPLFAPGFTPGSREWSGCAVLDPGGTVTLHFTAAGRYGAPRDFEQRLFATRGRLSIAGDGVRLDGWTPPAETIVADGRHYARVAQAPSVDGFIKGFRDPAAFRDPADGRDYIVFTASHGGGSSAPFDGVLGLARADGDGWTLLPPPIDATGTTSELERPHVVVHAGRYYCFWSTDRSRFAPSAPGVTGLYAMVAERLTGPWRPVNGTALVAGNPPAAPMQAYCWYVTGELDVISFVDRWAAPGAGADGHAVHAAAFGGTVAPWFRLAIVGDRIAVVGD